jgi:ankyrin repeat protein
MRHCTTETLTLFRLLLDHGADANLGDNVGKTPLVTANEKGNLEAIQLLLEHGADERISIHRYYSPWP